VPEQPGKTAVEMFQAAADGTIRALWICCTNPAQSMPDQTLVRRALERAELVIVQEAFSETATCGYADLLLPAASWGEKEGTVTNSERRISRVRAAVAAPGQARPDWAIAVDLARRLQKLLPERAELPDLFPYTCAESIWNEHRQSTEGRDLDITGLSYTLLEQAGPQQWPMPRGAPRGKVRLYEDGVYPTPDGRARFADTPYRPVAEPRDARYPFALNTGRLRDQWHGMSRTGTLGRLFGHVPEPTLLMHPQDLARRLIRDGDLVEVTSRRGAILVPVQASTDMAMGQVFLAMHWGQEALSGCAGTGVPLAGVNALTTSAFCPESKQPELKHAAVKILKAELPWSLLALAWLPQDEALTALGALRKLMPSFAFASCVPFSSPRTLADNALARDGVLMRCAAAEPPPDAVLAQIEEILGLRGTDVLRYADARKGQRRCMHLVPDGETTRLDAFLLAGDTRAEGWVRTVLQDQLDARAYGRLLLLPGAQAPVAVAARSKAVCSCFDVAQLRIETHLAGSTGSAAQRLENLQVALQCGTHCGSCLPELKRMVQTSMTAAAAPV